MTELAIIKYKIDKDKDNNYKVSNFNLLIQTPRLISNYTDKSVNAISIDESLDGYIMTLANIHTKKNLLANLDDVDIIGRKLVSDYILNSGSIGDMLSSKTPIIYTWDSICNEIVKETDYFKYITLGPNNNPVEFTFDNNSIIVVHPGSNTICEYEQWSGRSNAFMRKFSNIGRYINNCEYIRSTHTITNSGIISEYNAEDFIPGNDMDDKYIEELDKYGELRKEFIQYTDKRFNLISMMDNSMVAHDVGDGSLYSIIHYISDVYRVYRVQGSDDIKYSFNKDFVFSKFTDPDYNYAKDFEDFDVIIDPLFPEETMKGNKIHFDNIFINPDSDNKENNCSFLIEMTLYNPD